jgi:mitochondrial fission protein ELM1
MPGPPAPERAAAPPAAAGVASPTDATAGATPRPVPGPVPSPAANVWLLLGEKPGDNAQVEVLADALGWPCAVRRLRMQPEWVFGKPPVRASLAHVDLARSDPLEPPWPDLLITVGRRLSAAALWIREQSRGRTRLVLIGKPRRHLRRFDLIVASTQYRVRARANVVRIGLPLMRVDADAVAAAASAWRARLSGLPRPLVTVLVGGPTKAVRFDTTVARTLALGAVRSAQAEGGSVYVCTSRRTPASVVEAMAAALPAGTPLYRWRADDPDNPYRALLGLAERFVVTSDSVTMMVEVARLGRPLAVFRLPPRHRWLRALMRSRDLDAVARHLVARGLAAPLGAPWRAPDGPPGDDLDAVAARIRALASSPAGIPAAAATSK